MVLSVQEARQLGEKLQEDPISNANCAVQLMAVISGGKDVSGSCEWGGGIKREAEKSAQ